MKIFFAVLSSASSFLISNATLDNIYICLRLHLFSYQMPLWIIFTFVFHHHPQMDVSCQDIPSRLQILYCTFQHECPPGTSHSTCSKQNSHLPLRSAPLTTFSIPPNGTTLHTGSQLDITVPPLIHLFHQSVRGL